MAHHVYNTDAFVLDSSYLGEANKIYLIFTRELGVIRATAQGVRLIQSKLRYSLQDFSYSKLSVVRGKDLWRITNAKSEESLYSLYSGNKDVMKVIAHIFLLIKRLIHGEEKNEELFDSLAHAFTFLKTPHLTKDQINSFEYILVLRILNNLGYHGNTFELNSFLQGNWDVPLLDAMQKVKKVALQEINRSLKETQL